MRASDMNTINFDSYECMKILEKSGLKTEEAEAIVTSIRKWSDSQETGKNEALLSLATVNSELRMSVEKLRSELLQAIEVMRTESVKCVHELTLAIETVKIDLIKYIHDINFKFMSYTVGAFTIGTIINHFWK